MFSSITRSSLRTLSVLSLAGALTACSAGDSGSTIEQFASGDDDAWGWIMKTDVGMRSDNFGFGYFQAPRRHGLHNGIDVLGRNGEPLLAPCDGQVLVGTERSFGLWAQLVCKVPAEFSAGQTLYASMFYSHMDDFGPGLREGVRANISKGGQVGTSGQSGNAASTNPHAHFEVILHGSQSAALSEFHNGGNQSNTAAADTFMSALDSKCLTPNGFSAVHGVRRARRFDPFVVLMCLGAPKPAIQQPASSLQVEYHPWSRYYSADTFDVDTESLSLGRKYDAMEVYWARNEDGSYKLHALAGATVESVEYFVDGFPIGNSDRTLGSNFPDTYTFSSETNERLFEAKGFDAAGEQIALGVGLIDVTPDTAVFIRQLGPGYYDFGLERAPEGVDHIEVTVDGFPLTDVDSGSTKSDENLKIRYQFNELGNRKVAINTFNADGSLRGTLHREFTFR